MLANMLLIVITIILLVSFISLLKSFFIDSNKENFLEKKYNELLKDFEDYVDLKTEEVEEMEAKLRKILTQKKSGEVRLGQIAETLAPFLENFPYDPKKLRAMGNPIDYVCFTDDEVVFIEIKSGNAKHSPVQNKIKQQIQSGNVRFETYRINESGLNLDRKKGKASERLLSNKKKES